MRSKVQELIRRLTEAFPPEPIPERVLDWEPRPGAPLEERYLLEFLPGKRWDKLKPSDIDSLAESGSLLVVSLDALAYYLPAFLKRLVDDPFDTTLMGDLYALFAPHEREELKGLVARLTEPQRTLFDACLDYFEEEDPDDIPETYERPTPIDSVLEDADSGYATLNRRPPSPAEEAFVARFRAEDGYELHPIYKLVRRVVARGVESEADLVAVLGTASGDELKDAIELAQSLRLTEAVLPLRHIAESGDPATQNLAKFALARIGPQVPRYIHWLAKPHMQEPEALRSSAHKLAYVVEPESFRQVGAYLLDPLAPDWVKAEVAVYFQTNFAPDRRKSEDGLKEAISLLRRAAQNSSPDLAPILQKLLKAVEA